MSNLWVLGRSRFPSPDFLPLEAGAEKLTRPPFPLSVMSNAIPGCEKLQHFVYL